MNQETKKQINAKYERKLMHGERFWPDSIYKDVIVALGLFLLLVLLATFVGVHDSPKADPSDSSYVPRPEWYFMFLFKFLALYGQIPLLGKVEWIATVLIPGLAIGILTLLPFIDRSPHRYYAKRALPLAIMTIMVLGMILLTMLADIPTVATDGSILIGLLQSIAGLVVPGLAYIVFVGMAYLLKENAVRAIAWATGIASVLMVGFTAATLLLYQPPAVEVVEVPATLTDQISAGQDLYSIHCVECHGDDGKVEEITGVEGLEGKKISIINSKDVLYTVNDASMAEIIAYGRPDSGMNPFGKAYNPEGLSRSEIDYLVTFMRYSWDDRFEAPYIPPLYPELAEGEVPTYSVHIQPIVKRYCISCHRPGKDSNNYFMDSYANILTSGDNAEMNVVAGDMNSYLIETIQHQAILDETGSEIIGVMPPTRQLKQDIIDVFILWVMNGMPE
jgi:mono/diheme cytochrome c family protein